MKNKKMIFGIILLFAIIGICNIPNVSADTVEIPPLSYGGYYMGYLEYKDEILIDEIDSNGNINVYIMNDDQYDTVKDSGGLIWNYLIRWKDITYLSGLSFDITVDDDDYVVLYNKALFTEKTVYVDIGVRYYSPGNSKNIFWNLLIFIVIPIVAIVLVIAIPIILIRRHKRKTPKEPIII